MLFRNPVHPYTRALLTAVPEPNPKYRLDFSRLMEDKASIPARWPTPFTIGDGLHPSLVDLGGGHQVRADKKIFEMELVS
jgi:peptide/nickel transport system ATP-binding protein